MTYEIKHEEWMCDKCQEKAKKWQMPTLYKDMNDKVHKDEGDGYRLYYVCDDCRELEEDIRTKQGHHDEWMSLPKVVIEQYDRDMRRAIRMKGVEVFAPEPVLPEGVEVLRLPRYVRRDGKLCAVVLVPVQITPEEHVRAEPVSDSKAFEAR